MGKHKLNGRCVIERPLKTKCHSSVKDIAVKQFFFFFFTSQHSCTDLSGNPRLENTKLIAAWRIGMDSYLISKHFSLGSQRYTVFWVETSSCSRPPWGIGKQREVRVQIFESPPEAVSALREAVKATSSTFSGGHNDGRGALSNITFGNDGVALRCRPIRTLEYISNNALTSS